MADVPPKKTHTHTHTTPQTTISTLGATFTGSKQNPNDDRKHKKWDKERMEKKGEVVPWRFVPDHPTASAAASTRRSPTTAPTASAIPPVVDRRPGPRTGLSPARCAALRASKRSRVSVTTPPPVSLARRRRESIKI
jgi:hypothetical protein